MGEQHRALLLVCVSRASSAAWTVAPRFCRRPWNGAVSGGRKLHTGGADKNLDYLEVVHVLVRRQDPRSRALHQAGQAREGDHSAIGLSDQERVEALVLQRAKIPIGRVLIGHVNNQFVLRRAGDYEGLLVEVDITEPSSEAISSFRGSESVIPSPDKPVLIS